MKRGIAWITGGLIFLLLAVGLVFHRDLAVACHAVRLRNDPGHLPRLAGAAGGSAAEEALSAYIATRAGRERLREALVVKLLEHLREPGVETSIPPVDPETWDRLELEVRRLHYGGASEEWWIVFSARDDRGREIKGSTRANDVLVALERRLAGVETGEGASVRLPDHAGVEFDLRPSEVEKGEWRVVSHRR